jgi:ATP-dependent exoDNAse (exonuclease V), alpha subunit - helicase superfamily I member
MRVESKGGFGYSEAFRLMDASGPIEINDQFRQALHWMEETARPVFVTGKAGTGKSTLLEHFRETTLKKIAVLAPTGVAALNVRGQTIHSFCGFKPDITLVKVRKINAKKDPERAALLRKLDAVVIDEISMVRADLLDCVEKFLRLNGPKPRRPFGGLQLILIGDLYQLPPVVAGVEKNPLHPPLRNAVLLLRPLSSAGFLPPGIRRARKNLSPDRRRLHRPAQRRPQPVRRAGRPGEAPLPVRPGVRPARGRFLCDLDEHQRPGRRPQPGKARPPARPALCL